MNLSMFTVGAVTQQRDELQQENTELKNKIWHLSVENSSLRDLIKDIINDPVNVSRFGKRAKELNVLL